STRDRAAGLERRVDRRRHRHRYFRLSHCRFARRHGHRPARLRRRAVERGTARMDAHRTAEDLGCGCTASRAGLGLSADDGRRGADAVPGHAAGNLDPEFLPRHPPRAHRWPRAAAGGGPLAHALGDSVGHWEGDTLVIETVSVRNGSVLPLPLPPLAPQARFTERLRLSGPDRLELAMTIEDPATLTAPWNLRFEYRRAEGIDRLIHDVMENDRTAVDGDSLTIAPAP